MSMALDLTKLVVSTQVKNNRNGGFFFNKSLTTQDKVFIPSVKELKKKLKNGDLQVSDYSIMLGNENKACCLRSAEDDGRLAVYSGEMAEYIYGDAIRFDYGYAPRLALDVAKVTEHINAESDNSSISLEVGTDKKSPAHIKMGEYPQTIVPQELGSVLEQLYNGGQLMGGLKSTGRLFTSTVWKNRYLLPADMSTSSQLFDGISWNNKNPEFEYNGEKYVRVISRNQNISIKYSNGEETDYGKAEWVKVEPIDFEIQNWDNLPKTINPKGNGRDQSIMLQSTKILFSGLPFLTSLTQNRNMWQNSHARCFLNSSNLQELGINTDFAVERNRVVDFTKSGFLYEALDMTRESVKEYVIPKTQTTIEMNEFAGCVGLDRVVLHSFVSSISKNAFAGCNFKYIYYDIEKECLIFDKHHPQDEKKYTYITELDKLRKYLSIRYDNLPLNPSILSKLRLLANVFEKNNMHVTETTAKDLVSDVDFELFIKNCDFRFFKNELKEALADKYSGALQSPLFKFARALGCFSIESIKDKSGKDTQVILAQKASSVLATIIKSNLISDQDLENISRVLTEKSTPNADFVKFIGHKGADGKLDNLEMLLILEHSYPGLFAKTMTSFDIAKTFRVALGPNGTPVKVAWTDALIKFYQQISYAGVSDENRDIADLFIRHGVDQEDFVTALELRERAKKDKIPAHILGEELTETTILESIEKIKNQTENLLQDSKVLIDELYEKQFTYEMLSKHDPRNAIMGLYTSCCGTITSVFYGSEIAKATITQSDVQNMVVKNYMGEIVAKGTLYVNAKNGYAVFNDFELNEKYKKHETTDGFYNVPETSPERKERDMIFEAFKRGVLAFVAKYDELHPDKPINYVTVGVGHNRLNEQLEHYEESTKLLDVPADYEFEDAGMVQKVLYDRKQHIKDQQR